MRRVNLPLIFDTFFAGLCAFLLFFTAMRYYTSSAVIGLVFGIAAALLFGALACIYISRKQNKKLLLSRDEKDKNTLALHLSLSSDAAIKAMLIPLLEAEPDGKNLVTENEIYFFDFCLKPLSQDDIAGVIKFSSDKNKVILCNAVTPEAKDLADDFLIKVILIDELYPRLKSKGLLPEKYLFDGKKKPGFFKKVKARLNRRLCAPLFWCGISLLFFSFFTFFKIYYIVFGGLLLTLSAACLIFGAKGS